MNIAEIDGIGTVYGATLERAGIGTTEALLERGASAAGRAEIAGATGISAAQILEWVNHADLMRIRGVGSEYSDLLEAAGVDSPAELAQRNPANLAAKIEETVDAQPGIVRRVPTESEVADWIDQAKSLPKVVTHGSAAAGAGAGAMGSEPVAVSSSGAASATASMPVPTVAEAAPPAGAALAPATPARSVSDAATSETAGAQAAIGSASTAAAEEGARGTAQATSATSSPQQIPRTAAPMAAVPSSADKGDAGTVAASGGLWARIKRMFGAG